MRDGNGAALAGPGGTHACHAWVCRLSSGRKSPKIYQNLTTFVPVRICIRAPHPSVSPVSWFCVHLAQLMRAPRIVQQLCGQVPVERQGVPAVVAAPGIGEDHLHND